MDYILHIAPGPTDNTVYVDIRREEAVGVYGSVMSVTDDLRHLMALADICYKEEQK